MSDPTEINVPPEYVEFSRELLQLAKKYDIRRFELDITHWFGRYAGANVGVKFHGSTIDGRGRPEQSLVMDVTAQRIISVLPPEAGDEQ